MLKIVVPYLKHNKDYTLNDKTTGGVEQFVKLIYYHLPYHIHMFYYDIDESRKNVINRLVNFIEEVGADLVIANKEGKTQTISILDKIKIPILLIAHTNGGSISKINHISIYNELKNRGGKVAMVSKNQYRIINEMSTRIFKQTLVDISFINPSFSLGDEYVSDTQIDIITIGRANKTKNPFLLNKMANDLNGYILTSNEDLSKNDIEYHDKHKSATNIIYNLTHSETMNWLSKSGTYFSTCSSESWGITAMEAFLHGVPVILIRNGENKGIHSSEEIAPSPHFYSTFNGRYKEDFIWAYNKIKNIDRLELSQMAKEMHSKEKWVANFNKLIEETLDCHNNKKIYLI